MWCFLRNNYQTVVQSVSGSSYWGGYERLVHHSFSTASLCSREVYVSHLAKFIWQKRLIKNLKNLAIYIWNYSKVQKSVNLCKNNVWTNLLSFRCSQSDIDSFLPLRSILTFEVKRLTSEVRNHTYNDWTVLVHLSWMFAKWYKFMRLTSGLRGQKS